MEIIEKNDDKVVGKEISLIKLRAKNLLSPAV